MWTVQNQQLNVSVDMVFVKPILLEKAELDLFAERTLEKFGEYGLAPLKILQRIGNRLYDYEVSFWLFNQNGHFRLTSEKLTVMLQNARGETDANIVKACILKIADCLAEREIRETIFTASLQTTFASKEERDKFLASFADSKRGLSYDGIVYYLRMPPSNEIRFQIDRSMPYPEGIFLHWTTTARGKVTDKTVDEISEVCRSVLAKFELIIKS